MKLDSGTTAMDGRLEAAVLFGHRCEAIQQCSFTLATTLASSAKILDSRLKSHLVTSNSKPEEDKGNLLEEQYNLLRLLENCNLSGKKSSYFGRGMRYIWLEISYGFFSLHIHFVPC